MYLFRRVALATLLASAAAFLPGCSSHDLPEPAGPAPVQLANASTSNATLIAAARAWFTQAGAPVPVEWAEAQTAGQWVVAPLTEVHNPFAGSPYQGLRYVVAKVNGNNACQGRIVEFITPDQRLTRPQATDILLSGVQPLVAGGRPASQLGSFTGALLVYSPSYVYQTGMLYQQGTVHPRPARLYIQRRQQTQTAAARGNQQSTEPPVNTLLQVCQTTIVTTGYIQPGSTYTSTNSYEVTTCTVYNDGTDGTTNTPGSTWGGIPDGGSAPDGGAPTGENQCRRCPSEQPIEVLQPAPVPNIDIDAKTIPPCVSKVVTDIKTMAANSALTGGPIAQLINALSTNPNIHINFSMQSDLRNDKNIIVRANTERLPTGAYNIILNSDFLQGPTAATDLGLANDIIHEILHVYMFDWAEEHNIPYNTNLDAVMQSYFNGNQHQTMDGMIRYMATALLQYYNQSFISNTRINNINYTYCEYLAWGTITTTNSAYLARASSNPDWAIKVEAYTNAERHPDKAGGKTGTIVLDPKGKQLCL